MDDRASSQAHSRPTLDAEAADIERADMGSTDTVRPGAARTEEPRLAARALDFPALYEAHFSYVWNTLRRLGVRERDLPDVVHDVFLVVFKLLSGCDQTRPLRPWLFGIAFRVVSDYRRAARFLREVLDESTEAAPAREPPADEQLAAAQARRLVVRALDTLDLERRGVFVMHELDGMPVPEIAAALEIPVATVYSRLRRARQLWAAAVKRLRAREDHLR